MSYTYLLEQGEESSAASFSDIPLSALLSVTHMQETSCLRDSATDAYHDSRSGMTCEPSMASRGGDSCEPSAVASHAKTYQVQAGAQESQESEADCGPKCAGSLAKYNPNTALWKTRQCSLFGGLESFSGIWPQWGIMLHGECWARNMPDWLIIENESGYLPTIMHNEAEAFVGGPMRNSETWGNTSRLSHRLIGIWKNWRGREQNGRALETKAVCHPTFAEWMMNWPIQWTDLQESATDKFQMWLQWHGLSSTTN